MRSTGRLAAIFGGLLIAVTVSGDELAAEVYRESDIQIHAGISGQPGRIIHFGDVLPLVIDISFDADRVSVSEPDEGTFDTVWPEGDRPALLDRKTLRSADRLQTVFYFQIVDCPGEQWTCPGTREYLLPEFTVDYRHDDTDMSVSFRPWPSILTVSSAIPLDPEDQLYPFRKYFPTDAYPDPITGADRRREAYGFVGIGMAALLGGILMWPFRSGKSGPFTGKSQARWRELLAELENDDATDERRFFDRLRRSFVWYCTDELNIDPFNWLQSDAGVPAGEPDESHAELRSLFLELLHSPAGRGPELRSRFSDLAVHDSPS
jgi:hypothetical protein